MVITTRKATMQDLEAMLKIEASAIKGYGYLYDNRRFYFDGVQNRGEMVLALADGHPAGMGQYSVLPDGSGWLEILRVQQEYQNQGVGKAIYRRYLELAEQTHAPSAAMFTGVKNRASRGLAEKNGFSAAAEMSGYDWQISELPERPELLREFRPAGKELLEQQNREGWGSFLALNRTFFHFCPETFAYLAEKGMVYTDGENTAVVGCRMLKERGYHLAFFSGDWERCFAFAAELTRQEQLPKLSFSFPTARTDLKQLAEQKNGTATGDLLVLERKF